MKILIFKPNRKYAYKKYFEITLLGLSTIVVSVLIGSWIGGHLGQEAGSRMGTLSALVVNLLWLLPSLFLIYPYYRSLVYEIHEDEVIMHAGVVTRSVTHVPLRMITNLKVHRGPFDRLFGLGTIDIQTAGTIEGNNVAESLVGLCNFREVYDHMSAALRRHPS
jgi:membrane protein YdbS with pleckstrin-like domain